jgi:hypothetical protein
MKLTSVILGIAALAAFVGVAPAEQRMVLLEELTNVA